MAELIVVSFRNNLHRASGVLDELRVLDEHWISELRDAIAVHRHSNGEIEMDQRYQPTRHQGRGWGDSLGFLVGATLAQPISGKRNSTESKVETHKDILAASIRGARSAAFLKDNVNIPEDFILGVRELIRWGDSAIFTLTESLEPQFARARFQAYGGLVCHVTMNNYQQSQIEKALESEC